MKANAENLGFPKRPILLDGTESAEEAEAKLNAAFHTPIVDDEKDEWPDPENLGSELPPVQAFDLDLLPESLRPMVQDIAERMGCVYEFPAAAAVVMLAAVTNRRAMIQPKVHDSGWRVVPNLWGLVIGDSGTYKTPSTQEVIKIASQIEDEWWGEHDAALKQFELDQERAEIKLAAWKQVFTNEAKKNPEADGPPRPVIDLVKPEPRRLFTNNPTVEKLHELLSVNPAGMTLYRDELAGWFAELSKPGREGDRAFFLECFNGSVSQTYDRIARGSIHARNLTLSMFGGTQPVKLPAFFRDEIENGASSDGLLSRYQIAVFPDTPLIPSVDREPNKYAMDEARKVYRRLAAMDASQPLLLRFDAPAQELFFEWLADLKRTRAGDEIAPSLREHLAKYDSLMPKLAGLWSLADGPERTISLFHARKAAACCEWLESHARRVYSSRIDPAKAAVIRLGAKLKKGWKRRDGDKLKENQFTVREVYLKGWIDLKEPEVVRAALRFLDDHGWVRPVDSESSKSGGRPPEIYEINPRILGKDGSR
jgi:putative DNA primase/helicase